MLRNVLAWLLGLALFNLGLFVVCFYWDIVRSVLMTPQGMFVAFLIIVCLIVPVAFPRFIEYRKKEALRRQMHLHKIRQEVEAVQRKEIGIDF